MSLHGAPRNNRAASTHTLHGDHTACGVRTLSLSPHKMVIQHIQLPSPLATILAHGAVYLQTINACFQSGVGCIRDHDEIFLRTTRARSVHLLDSPYTLLAVVGLATVDMAGELEQLITE